MCVWAEVVCVCVCVCVKMSGCEESVKVNVWLGECVCVAE
jgi:hypothetical protein